MDVLLTFTGFRDPFFEGLVPGEQHLGPVLSLLTVRKFEYIYLVSTPGTQRNTSDTESAISQAVSDTAVRTVPLTLADPTDYRGILHGLRALSATVQEEHPGARFSVAVASGTPHMHACWFMLVASGELPGTILNVRPPQFVTTEKPLVDELDLGCHEFPSVRFSPKTLGLDDLTDVDADGAIRHLGIVGDHPAMRRALEAAALLAESRVPVLVLGETGTGKEVVSRFIHLMSGRPREKFVAVNCAAIPTELVESTLFGHRKGAFSGAVVDQQGKFEQADGGTLFLDEVGDLPSAAQAKLLRVVQDGLLDTLGAKKPTQVDVRLVCATNRDLQRLVSDGEFREDLHYRLNVGEVKLPALRDRRSDIPKLALSILERTNASVRRPKKLSSAALTRLRAHNWPGNIRDLQNVIERSVLLCRSVVMEADDLLITDPITYEDPYHSLPEPMDGFSIEGFLGGARKQLFLRALDAAGENQSEAARLLGVTPQAVHKFLQKKKPGESTGVVDASTQVENEE